MKKITLLPLAVFIIALLVVSCRKETPYQDGDRTVVPYSLKTSITKVSYAGSIYDFKPGDRLAISSTDRPDIEGELSEDGEGNWKGSVSYLTSLGEPTGSTSITATLIHADNSDQSTYANGIAYQQGSASSLLQAAVEKYSLFKAIFNYGATGATFQQQACFIDATVTFVFENGNFHLAGETSVEVVVDNSLTVSGRAMLSQDDIDPSHYNANFVIALPGGTTLTDASIIQICDRNVQMIKTGTTKTLAANNKYTVDRSYDFKPQLGDPFWSDGTYGRIAHSNGVTVTGIIVFVNNYEDSDESDLAKEARALTEKSSGFGHALVMSLKNADNDDDPSTPLAGIKWATSNAQYGSYSPAYITKPSHILQTNNVSGYSNTNNLTNTNNIAANKARSYRSGDNMGDKGTSGWFLPSIGQWVYSISIRGFGGADVTENWLINQSDNKWLGEKGELSNLVLVKNNGSVNANLLVTSLNDRMQVLYDDFGCEYDAFGMTANNGNSGDNYWSSSETNSKQAIRMNFGSVEQYKGNYYSSIKTSGVDKNRTSANYDPQGFFVMKVRPFLAF